MQETQLKVGCAVTSMRYMCLHASPDQAGSLLQHPVCLQEVLLKAGQDRNSQARMVVMVQQLGTEEAAS